MELKRMLTGEEDYLHAMVAIKPGIGGTESQAWTAMLVRIIVCGQLNSVIRRHHSFPCTT